MSAIGVQLGHLRVAQGLTQQQLAERTGLRRDTISALERGKSQAIEFATLACLCDALGVAPGDLLTLAPTAHVAPILGGEDEDAILAERMAQDEQDIAAFRTDPLRALQYLTLGNEAADDVVQTAPEVVGSMRPVVRNGEPVDPTPVDYAAMLRAMQEAAEKARDLDAATALYDVQVSVADASRIVHVVYDQWGLIVDQETEKMAIPLEGEYVDAFQQVSTSLGAVSKQAIVLAGASSPSPLLVYVVNEGRFVLIPAGEVSDLSAPVATSTARLR